MVVLISSESRVRNPYALPVQCSSYVGITVKQMRAILNGVITAMKARNMDVNGIFLRRIQHYEGKRLHQTFVSVAGQGRC